MSNKLSAASSLKHIPASCLTISEPPPDWFGNPANALDPSWTNDNWLKSRFHFSFAEYSNPANSNFGVLRVLNDDLVQPSRGFGTHPHRDAEIVTYVVRGELTHKDSMGTEETLDAGSIQFMTAGSGIRHSESNDSGDSDLRFIQMWLTPRKRGLRPNYGSMRSSSSELGLWQHLVSDTEATAETPVKINTDANISVVRVGAGDCVELKMKEGRQGYLLIVEGSATVGMDGVEIVAAQHDAAEVLQPGGVSTSIRAGDEGAHCLFVEMACDGSGRTDL
eukprot:TRINITY_DN3509_c0_g1_i2.p1 TRINITY_DN3509_c0_g1~~TRINITY_DN3509_c0_g1_i2.p1  ORF type:complete len:278 (+),score=45.50 TRINITY_DN3509_c0_g1_i2:62-895(+)